MRGLCFVRVTRKRLLAFAAGAALMLVLYVWIDREVAVRLQDHRPDWLAALADLGSELGEGYVVLLPASLIGAWFWIRNKREAAAKSWFVFCCASAAGMTALATKVVLARWRPSRLSKAYGFEFFQFKSDQWSFPSGHMTTATAAAVALSILYPRWRWLWWSYPLVVGTARLCAVAHYPSDVLGGAMIGAALALLVNYWWRRLDADRRLLHLGRGVAPAGEAGHGRAS